MICDEAEGCLRFAGEFPQSMSDFKPGGCNTEHSLCLKPQADMSEGERFVCLRQPETLLCMFSGFFMSFITKHTAACDEHTACADTDKYWVLQTRPPSLNNFRRRF